MELISLSAYLGGVEIQFSKSAVRALRRSNKGKLIRQKIGEYAENPASMARNLTKLEDRPEYRLRVQDWRVIFRVEDDVMYVDDVSPRGGAY
ncbi:MAG: type II toxin-antitoxin system RelE family toxin [Sphingomicrobium sp.]